MALIAKLSRRRSYTYVHPNFYNDHLFPIGISKTHAFIVAYAKQSRGYYVYSCAFSTKVDTPHKAMRESRQFNNPWKRWPETLKPIGAACCFEQRVCIADKDYIVVLDASCDWSLDFKLKVSKVNGCSMNKSMLAFYRNVDNNCHVYVFDFSKKALAQAVINNARGTCVDVPSREETNVYFGFTKSSGESSTCSFSIQGANLTINKRFNAWPTNEETGRAYVDVGPEGIYADKGNFLQYSDKKLICFYASKNNLVLPAAGKVIHAQTVDESGLLVFQGNNSLLISDQAIGVNFCIEPSELCGPSIIASASRLKGMPDYLRCYPAFQAFDDTVVILFPNGSLCYMTSYSSLPPIQLAEDD